MPWGSPDSREMLFCVACGVFGSEWVERATWPGLPLPPTKRVRLCPRCAQAGWTLTGPKETGVFFLRHRAVSTIADRAPGGARIDDEEPAAIPLLSPLTAQGAPARPVRLGESGPPATSRVFAEDRA